MNGEMEEDQEMGAAWKRDDPSGRLEAGSGRSSAVSSNSNDMRLDAIVERNKIGMDASEEERFRRTEEKKRSEKGQVFANGLACPSTSQSVGAGGSVRVLVSNNDQSVKEFRLRPPMKWRSAANSNSSGGERIESGLPGLSRLQTVEFPTCINHCEFQ